MMRAIRPLMRPSRTCTAPPLTKWYGSYEGPKRGNGSQQDGGSQQSGDLHKNQAARTR
jgi:hypothetical protein